MINIVDNQERAGWVSVTERVGRHIHLAMAGLSTTPYQSAKQKTTGVQPTGTQIVP